MTGTGRQVRLLKMQKIHSGSFVHVVYIVFTCSSLLKYISSYFFIPADDSTLIFGEDEVSLNTALDIVDKFAGCSGLRANFDKTQVLWFGAKRGCGEELRTQKPIIWNHGGKFKLLGIEFDVNNEDVTGINFPKKLESVKKLLNDWSFRSLSLLGKICVVKTLAMPILIQIFTVLPTPPDNFLKDLEKMFFSFIWDKKGDRIKRNVIINSKNEGGLQMPHVPSFCAALKMSWLKKSFRCQLYNTMEIIIA